MTNLRLSACTFAVILSAPAAAQLDWQPVATATNPSALFHAASAHDILRGRTVMFGGTDGTYVPGNATWEFDGVDWTAVPVAGPSPRYWSRMAFDAARGVCVLFGGSAGFDETWEYDGVSWTQRLPATVPAGRFAHAMWYDTARGVTMMFGGQAQPSGAVLNDTWAWDGVDWTQLQPANSPPGLWSIEAAYDLARDRAVMFAGALGNPPVRSQSTWEWDGAGWSQVTTQTTPQARWGNKATFHLARQRVVMTGGDVGGGANGDDAWEFDGYDWHRLNTPTGFPARNNHILAYDMARDALLQYGGFPTNYDTWELVETSAARWSAYGSGCPSSSGVAPTLDAQPGSAPVLGQPLVLELGDLPATPLVFVAAGLSGSQSGGVPLPIDLSSLGMPGCAQFVGDLGLLQAAPAVAGAATWSIAMPATPSLAGFGLYFQGLVPDAAANAFGLVLTNAGRGVIG